MIRGIAGGLFALLLVACSADPNEQANKLFVEAQQLIQIADKQELDKAIQTLITAEQKLKAIVTKHPAANLAVQLASGQAVGNVSLNSVRTQIASRQADKLFLEAQRLIETAGKQDPKERLQTLVTTEAKLRSIVDDYPTTALALQLASGQSIGMVSLFAIRKMITDSERESAHGSRPKPPPPADAITPVEEFSQRLEQLLGCHAAVDTASSMAPLSRGKMSALTVATAARKVPNLTFRDPAGRERTLSEWRGRIVLLNLWATWCVPCLSQMPTLDGLQEKFASLSFEVVAINIDTRDAEKPKTWLKEIGVTHLAYYTDPTAKVLKELKAVGRAYGMPTTLLIDSQGCELGYVFGPAEWTSEDAVKLVQVAIEKAK